MNLTQEQFEALAEWVEAAAHARLANHIVHRHHYGQAIRTAADNAENQARSKAHAMLCGHASFTDGRTSNDQ